MREKSDRTIEEFLEDHRQELLIMYVNKENFDSEVYSGTFLFFLLTEGFLKKEEDDTYSFTEKFDKYFLMHISVSSAKTDAYYTRSAPELTWAPNFVTGILTTTSSAVNVTSDSSYWIS